MKKNFRRLLLILSLPAGIVSCSKLTPLPEDSATLDGPVEGLSPVQNAQFLAGDRAFNTEVFTIETGLGPYFVATACASCHAGDGKGHPYTTLTRFGQNDSSGNLVPGGPQLQNRAIPGYTPETIPAGATYSKFTPPANTGLGFLAALTDAQILANADPDDLNGDGISGIPNYITAPWYFSPQPFHQPFNGKYIGRFGKKAAAIDLLHQTVNAYNQDMGITSPYALQEPAIHGITNPYPNGAGDPEISAGTVLNVVFYLRTLKAPVKRNINESAVIAGSQIFSNLKCAACHTPEWTTESSDLAVLSNKTFYPYTDLLLHDMGPGLDDGYTEGSAKTSEWRTPPLWGLGLAKISQGGNYYLLHDGRATTMEQAILMHGGEASESKSLYEALSESEKKQLIEFLESL